MKPNGTHYEDTADTVIKVLKDTAPRDIPADADHYKLALATVDVIERNTGERPIYSLGQLWRVQGDLWVPTSIDTLAGEVGQLFGGFKFCKRGADFNSVARLAAGIVTDDRFFDEAPIGVAGPLSFSRIIPTSGEVVREPLGPEHRQRMRLKAEPDFDAEAPLWDRLLDHAFPPGTDDDLQRDLLQMLFGGALSRSLWRHRIAALLLGATTSGKTTLLNILASHFPPDMVGATNPQRWGSEYYLAALAGKVINLVGELDPDAPIPGGSFKSVVGCDVIEGRHPTHRPFSFICTAAHFVNANRLPPTVDRSDAFFRRWRIIHFTHTVSEAEVVVDFAERIIDEESGAVTAWMLDGAQRLAVARSGIPETPQHRALINKWRYANNSALQFLNDREKCELDPDAETKGVDLYETYRGWASANGVRPFGRNSFFEALDESGGRLGIGRQDRREGVVFCGVSLRP